MPQIRECIAKYLAELARRGASKHTLRNYGSDLEQFAAYFEPPGETTSPDIEQLDIPLLREWLGGLYDQRLTTVSIRRKLAAVRAMYKFLLQEGILQTNAAKPALGQLLEHLREQIAREENDECAEQRRQRLAEDRLEAGLETVAEIRSSVLLLHRACNLS